MDNVNVIVAENLKSIRVSKGWSQSFVADQLGIAQRTISRAECGCGVSKRTLKMLCNLYQVNMATLYNECVQETPKGTQVVPDDVAVKLLIRNSFIQDLEQEVILRYTDTIQKEALLMREDIENIIPEALTMKKSYSLQDVISACMLVNQKTLSKVRNMAIA
ncbi:MAG: helix-turn-helix transcriptional regulator [Lachnospiraceae bacterium]|nr:helix-turn-helix transcriptional regulator [Lachnospiraceae bacterium]